MPNFTIILVPRDLGIGKPSFCLFFIFSFLWISHLFSAIPNLPSENNMLNDCSFSVSLANDIETCQGEPVILCPVIRGESNCNDCTGEYEVRDTNHCNGRRPFVLWLEGGIYFSNVDLQWKENSDGTATLKGTVFDYTHSQSNYELDLIFSNSTDVPPNNGPRNHRCNDEDDNNWMFYNDFTGTLSKSDGSWTTDISRRGKPFQLGNGANFVESENEVLGAAGRFNTSDDLCTNGGLNYNLGPCITQQNGEIQYLWSTGETTPIITVAPQENTSYTLTVIGCDNCEVTKTIDVIVDNSITVDAGADQEICRGESVELIAQVDNIETCEDCVGFAIENTDRCERDYNYVMWLKDAINNRSRRYANVDLQWRELPNGTATLKGTIVDIYGDQEFLQVDVLYSGRTTTTPQDSPKPHECHDEDDTGWVYYTEVTGTVSNTDGSWSFDITRKGPSFQIGNGANVTEDEVGKYGACGWFNTDHQQYTHGDFNLIIGECNETSGTDISYLWSTGETTPSINVSPDDDTVYEVTVSGCNTCSDISDAVTVTVNEAFVDAGADQSICLGESITLSATGEGDFTWSTGDVGASIEVSPTATTTYTVNVIKDGCESTDEVIVTVNEAFVDAGADQSICLGESITLNATGEGDFTWSTGNAGSSIEVSPTATTTYTVTVTKDGCESTDEVTVTVNEAFVDAGENKSICLGESITLNATGEGDFTWSTGDTGSSIEVSPTATTTYTVTVIKDGCESTDEVMITVNEAFVDAGEDKSICLGDSVTLTATGEGDFTWSTGDTGTSIAVAPTTTTTYLVTVIKDGCESTDEVTVNVGEASVDAGTDQVSCFGEPVTLNASGNGEFLWSTGETTSSIVVTPNESTTYSVTLTLPGGCQATDDVFVELVDFRASAGLDLFISCEDTDPKFFRDTKNQEVILIASEGDSYLWSTGETTRGIIVSPEVTTDYEVQITIMGCTDSDTVRVVVEECGEGSEEEEGLVDPILYPSRANLFSKVFIDYYAKSEDNVSVSIFDIGGLLISGPNSAKSMPGMNTFQIDLNGVPSLQSGMYLVQIVENGRTTIKKMIIE